MMKRILIIVFLLVLNFTLKAQILQQPNTYGIGWKRTGADTLIYIPSDTLSVPSWGVGKTHIARKGTTLYYWDGSKWSAISGGGGVGTYTAGNGLTLSGSQFKLGGTLTEPTIITGSGTNLLKLDGYTSANVGYLGIGTDFGYIRFGDGGSFSPTYENEIYGGVSQIGLKTTGDIYLDAGDIYTIGVPTVSSTTGRKVALIDTATGKVERIDPATLVTTPALQQVLTAGSTLTTNHTIDFGGNDLKIKGDSLQIVNTDGDVRIKLIPSAGGVGSAATRLTFINADAAEMFIQSGDEYLETYSGWYIRNEIGGNPALSVNGKTGGQTASYIEVLQGAGKLFEIGADSFSINPPLGVLNIDSLRTWSGISDTAYKKPMTWDTRNGRWEYAANWPQQKINLVFGAGSGADSDTTAFTTSAIYGSFFNDADTIVVTSMRSVLQGTSPDITYKVWYNDSLNVEAGSTALVTAGSQVTNTTTGTNVTSFDVTKIPPGVWVWVKTSAVATKPKYFSLTINGYRK